jgi:hypothetical protein
VHGIIHNLEYFDTVRWSSIVGGINISLKVQHQAYLLTLIV